MNILAIIPARGGSKELPLKNIQKLAGKPLIEYSIIAAKNSKKIDKIIVSTDNKKIANISSALGADVPFLRPESLATDNSLSIDTVKHTLQFLHDNQSYVPNIILLLQPTSPFRTTTMIDTSISMLQKSQATSVLSVTKIKIHSFKTFRHKTKYLSPLNSNFEKYTQRQQIPDLYYPTGSIYTFWYNTLKKYDSLYGPRILPLIEDEFIDIDNKFDLFVSEMKILNWNNYKKTHN